MSHDLKTKQILNFLEQQAEAYPSLSGELAQLSDLYTRKLWHQLTLLLQAVSQREGAAPLLQPLYETFVSDFKHKLNKLTLAQFQIAVARQMPDSGQQAFFCKTAAEEASKDDRQASSYILCELARMHLDANQVADCKERLDEAAAFLESAAGIDTIVQAAYYRAKAAYYKLKGPAAEFYKHALLLLAYAPLSEVRPRPRCGSRARALVRRSCVARIARGAVHACTLAARWEAPCHMPLGSSLCRR